VVAGLAHGRDDHELLEAAAPLFDALYEDLRGRPV
jgi:hypothetical protein